ncbi:MAG: imidazole glycerol phosphate synthase cyclase subunit [Planctomycetaceae bacterium]|nr:imidazole glycerol phosphate synthase cyclase subunit [Planctomycetaceae bacterium]
MKPVRIMPCLNIMNGRVVKGVRFVDLKDAADPVEAAVAYAQGGADELAFLDITATVEKRIPIWETLTAVTSAVEIPVTVGGGIRNTGDVAKAFDCGASKVSISSAAFRDPQFIKEAVKLFGGNRVAVAVDTDVNDSLPSRREILVDGGCTRTGADAVEFGVSMRDIGVSAILATSKTADGSREGYDIEGLRQLADATGIPIIASGGAGALEHFLAAVREGGAEVLLAASVFHFGTFTVRQVKEFLRDNGVPVVL